MVWCGCCSLVSVLDTLFYLINLVWKTTLWKVHITENEHIDKCTKSSCFQDFPFQLWGGVVQDRHVKRKVSGPEKFRSICFFNNIRNNFSLPALIRRHAIKSDHFYNQFCVPFHNDNGPLCRTKNIKLSFYFIIIIMGWQFCGTYWN